MVRTKARRSKSTEPSLNGSGELHKAKKPADHVKARTASQVSGQDGGAHLTDAGNAARLVQRHGRDLRYCWPWKSWLAWDGSRWAPDETGAIVRRVGDTRSGLYRWVGEEIAKLGDTSKDAEKAALAKKLFAVAKHVLAWESAKATAASIDLARSEPGVPILPSELDTNPFLLNVCNGTIDLTTGRLREHRREDLITKLAPVAFDPDAQCHTWERCLHKWMGGNACLVRYLQQTAGYSLTGDVREQCLFFFHGAGSNGKSTYLGALREVMGDYAIQAVAELLVQRGGNEHPTERADLFGNRFVATIETDEGKRMAESLLKQLTGGDAVRARKMKKDFSECKPTWKIFLAANHKPKITGTDFAVWRRVKLVPFTVTIPDGEKDKTLPEKLRAELPGILAWAVAGCLDWMKHGLVEPEEVKAATDAYRAEQDAVALFLRECCILHPSAKVQSSRLLEEYAKWTGDKLMTPVEFANRLKAAGYEVHKGTGGRMFWKGISFQEPADDQSGG